MWVSVATRPTRSRFTRVQRLTCCLVMCLTAVLFNLLGYIVQLNSNAEAQGSSANPDPPIIVLGPISITAFTLTISVISAGCSIPVNMIIVLLFQQRRIREPEIMPENPYDRFKTAMPEGDGKSMLRARATHLPAVAANKVTANVQCKFTCYINDNLRNL